MTAQLTGRAGGRPGGLLTRHRVPRYYFSLQYAPGCCGEAKPGGGSSPSQLAESVQVYPHGKLRDKQRAGTPTAQDRPINRALCCPS